MSFKSTFCGFICLCPALQCKQCTQRHLLSSLSRFSFNLPIKMLHPTEHLASSPFYFQLPVWETVTAYLPFLSRRISRTSRRFLCAEGPPPTFGQGCRIRTAGPGQPLARRGWGLGACWPRRLSRDMCSRRPQPRRSSPDKPLSGGGHVGDESGMGRNKRGRKGRACRVSPRPRPCLTCENFTYSQF